MKKFTASAIAMTFALSAGAAFAEGHKDWEAKFKKMDTNGDGMISMQEYTAKTNEKFKKMDTDGDGMVSMEEKKAYKDKKD